MNASDTVIHLDDIDEGRMPDSYASLRNALEKQAEISFKAGIREVMEWIENQRVSEFTFIEGIGRGIPLSEEKYQAKLKDLGINNLLEYCEEK